MSHPRHQHSSGLGSCTSKREVSNLVPSYVHALTVQLRWLYALTVGMDANFRLKSRLRGPVAKDPPLGPGFSYFVEFGAYADFIHDYVDEEDVRA